MFSELFNNNQLPVLCLKNFKTESSTSNTSVVSNKVGEASKTNPSQPVSASSDVVQTTAISDRPKIKAKFKKKPVQPTTGNANVNEPSQATLDANYARGVMAGVAAMKPQFKAEVSIF